MSVIIHFADPDTGVFIGESWSGPSSSIPKRAGVVAVDVTHVEGFDWLSMRVDHASGKIVDYKPPAPPNTEFETFAWDASIRRYVGTPTAAALLRDVRAERDRRLAACDWVVVRAYERGEPVQEKWAAYREALRDITFDPFNIVWPEPPT